MDGSPQASERITQHRPSVAIEECAVGEKILPTAGDSADLYLDLLKKCLTHSVYGSETVHIPVQGTRNRLARAALTLLNRAGIEVTRSKVIPREVYEEGYRGRHPDLLGTAETMIGMMRLDNVHHCVEDVLADNVPGDLIETGVWRGGATILMRAILRARGVTDRYVYAADSFQGVPPPDTEKYPQDEGLDLSGNASLAVPLAQVRANFARYGLLDEQVRFLEGWFSETLPTLSDSQWAVIRLDGDLYESTIDALANLYPNLSVGGYLIVDDYGAYRPCRQAVHDYREEHGIDEPIRQVDFTGVYWRREV